jgi:hypothetical protein
LASLKSWLSISQRVFATRNSDGLPMHFSGSR